MERQSESIERLIWAVIVLPAAQRLELDLWFPNTVMLICRSNVVVDPDKNSKKMDRGSASEGTQTIKL